MRAKSMEKGLRMVQSFWREHNSVMFCNCFISWIASAVGVVICRRLGPTTCPR